MAVSLKQHVNMFQHFLETLDFTIHIGSTPTFLYFDLYLNTAYAAHYYVYKSCLLQSVKYKSKVKPFFLTKDIRFQAKDLKVARYS